MLENPWMLKTLITFFKSYNVLVFEINDFMLRTCFMFIFLFFQKNAFFIYLFAPPFIMARFTNVSIIIIIIIIVIIIIFIIIILLSLL